MGKVEGEEKKKIISFYESTLDTFVEFYSFLLKLEIFLSDLPSDQFIKVNNEDVFMVKNDYVGIDGNFNKRL